MKSIFYALLVLVLVLLSGTPEVSAALYNIQFTNKDPYTGTAYASSTLYTNADYGVDNGQYWNKFADVKSQLPSVTVRDASALSSITFKYNRDNTGTNNSNIGLSTPSIGMGFVDTGYVDLMSGFTSSSVKNNLDFAGLATGTYELYVYTQSDVSGQSLRILDKNSNLLVQTTRTSVNAESTFKSGQNYIHTYVYVTDGTLKLKYNSLSGGTAVINALQLSQVSSSVPEPTSVILMCIGGLFFVLR